MQVQDLSGFAKRTGFPIFTLKRVLRPEDGTPSRVIPRIYPSKTARAPVETGLSVEEARGTYLTSKGYNPRREALRTWVSVCTTRGEILEALWETEDGSEEERFALVVMDEIFMKETEQVSSLDAAIRLCEDTQSLRESGIERVAFLKAYEIYKKEEGGMAQ